MATLSPPEPEAECHTVAHLITRHEDWTSGFILRGFRRVGCLRDNASSAL